MERLYDPVKELKGGKGTLVLDLKSNVLKIPLNEKDKIAVAVLDIMADMDSNLTVAEISEICDYIKFYMELAQIIKYEPNED